MDSLHKHKKLTNSLAVGEEGAMMVNGWILEIWLSAFSLEQSFL